MSEKLCLKWNDFQENVNTAFASLRDDKEFTDVTLACEDGKQIEAHKVILAASSPFFQNLLNKNAKKHHHPLIYMKGVRFEDLYAIIDFLYLGEAKVFQESLSSFLSIAEDLKLKGLMGQTKDSSEEKALLDSTHPSTQRMYLSQFQKGDQPNLQTNLEKFTGQRFALKAFDEQKVTIPDFSPGDIERLDEEVKSMMEASSNLDPSGRQKAKICKLCGKEGYFMAIRDHIEGHHLEGVSLPCNVCGKDFRLRNNLRRHICISR